MFESLNSPAEIWTAFFAVAAATGAVIEGVGRLIWRARDLGRSWVVTVPMTPGALATIERTRPVRGTITRKHPTNGDESETFILAPDAAYPTRRGPLHLISPYGANLVAPSKDEALDDNDRPIKGNKAIFSRFRIWDALVYWRATRENDMEDLYSAQQPSDHWAVKLAPVAIVLFIGLMGFMGFLLWKIMPLINQAG